MSELTTNQQMRDPVVICPHDATGNQLSVLSEYSRYLATSGATWQNPDLCGFRDYLLTRDETRDRTTATGKTVRRRYKPLSPASVRGALSIVRSRLADILRDGQTMALLLQQARQALVANGESATVADCKAMADLAVTRVRNAIDPKSAIVKVETIQDRTSTQVGIRLTREQASELLSSPGVGTLSSLRDTALLAVMLCTGTREKELCNLDVRDMRTRNESGDLCLHIRHGKGNKSRLCPWGAGQWALAIVDRWRLAAGITKGAVFRGFYRGNARLRPGRLSVRAVQIIIARYSVMIDGEQIELAPHDLRRTYARRCYDVGMDILAIQQNLGHADHKTTLRYIGALSGEKRRPPALYTFNLGDLERVTQQSALPGV
jgi:site-specific recombinase XerD